MLAVDRRSAGQSASNGTRTPMSSCSSETCGCSGVNTVRAVAPVTTR